MIAGTVLTTLGVAAVLLQAVVAPSGGVSRPEPEPRITFAVTDAHQRGCRDGVATWMVATALRVVGTQAVVDTATLTGRYAPQTDSAWRDVSVDVVEPNGLANATAATPEVRIAVPCNARRADLVAKVRLAGTGEVLRSDATFLSAGVAMSSSAIGTLGVVALAGAAAAARALRRRRS